jgi:hypothetical protein
MSGQAAAEPEPVNDLVVLRETVVSYILPPDMLRTTAPMTPAAGSYVARFDSGGVGEPAFAVLPYTDGMSAQFITLAEGGEVTERSPRFRRTAERSGEVDYQLHMAANFSGWTPPSTEAPA